MSRAASRVRCKVFASFGSNSFRFFSFYWAAFWCVETSYWFCFLSLDGRWLFIPFFYFRCLFFFARFRREYYRFMYKRVQHFVLRTGKGKWLSPLSARKRHQSSTTSLRMEAFARFRKQDVILILSIWRSKRRYDRYSKISYQTNH